MKHETVAILCCVVLTVAVCVIDFDEANIRWCKVYPETCAPDIKNGEQNE